MSREDLNRQNAMAFYRLAFEGQPARAVTQYVGDTYIQHNPMVADGPGGFIEYFERMQREYPKKSLEFLRCIAQDNLVALHTYQQWEGFPDYVTMDFFRFDSNGKIVEHWDAIQEVPETMAHENGMR